MRTQRGLTLLDVARQLGVKEATAQRYESGEIKNIKHETIVSLSEILNCSPSYLMGWEESPLKSAAINKDIVNFKITPQEQTLVKKYRALDERGKILINTVIDAQIETKNVYK